MSSKPTDRGAAEPVRLPRLLTGNPQLDAILGGGFPANSINILMGEPGTGKTILAERLIFANADDTRPILFLTTLSEPLDKVVRHLQQFAFYDESKLGTVVHYDSIGADLAEKGLDTLVPRLREAILTLRPKILVIDSFKAIHDLAQSVTEMRRVMFEVAGLLTAYETTVFLVGEYASEDVAKYSEFAIADGMVELLRNKLGTRDERFLRVLKLRGSSYLEGMHAFRLGRHGLDVFPRLVSPVVPPSYRGSRERIVSGIRGLDALIGGGLLAGRSAFVMGPTGSGKTTLSLQFVLEGVRRGEPCLYVSFEENPSQLQSQLRALGVDPDEVEKKGLRMLYASPVELQIDSVITTIFDAVREGGVRRVVIDAVGDLASAANDSQRLHGYLYALSQHFAVAGVTSMFTHERTHADDLDRRLSALADSVLLLDLEVNGGRGRRTLRIAKSRGTAHDLDVHELRISPGGVEVS